MSISELRIDDGRTQFYITPVQLRDFITQLDDRDLRYLVSTTKKISWNGESYGLPFIGLCSETIDTAYNSEILTTVAKDLPTYMIHDIVFSKVDNVASVEVFIGKIPIVTEMIDNSDSHKLSIFGDGGGIVMNSISGSDIRMQFNTRDASQPSSLVVNITETYVLMSKIIAATYTHETVLHEIPLIYEYDDFTFLFDNTGIAFYNEPVDLSKWHKHLAIDETPHHTVSKEHKSIEMDISSPSKVLDALPGFNAEETNVNIDTLADSGVYRVPISADSADYAAKYLESHPNVVRFEIKDLAFVSPTQRERNTQYSNKRTAIFYNQIRLLLGEDTTGEMSSMNVDADGFSEDEKDVVDDTIDDTIDDTTDGTIDDTTEDNIESIEDAKDAKSAENIKHIKDSGGIEK